MIDCFLDGGNNMNVKIGVKIRALRRKADVTQEKFAEYLGVTPQAVSRWESEAGYPDIEILPAIANFFNVTIDELMCFDVAKNQDRIDEIYEQVNKKWNKGLIPEVLEILRNAVQEFPNNYGLLHTLGYVITLGDKSETEEEKQKNLREAISIYERILSDCLEDSVRYGVMQKLAYAYDDLGEKNKAIETAKKLPSVNCTSNVALAGIYKGEDLFERVINNILSFADILARDLTILGYRKYDDDLNKKIDMYKKAIGVFELIYENGDYGFYNCRLAEFYMDLAKSYIMLDDIDNIDNIENTLDCLEKSVKYAVVYDTAEEFTHTSVIFEGRKYDPVQSSKNYAYNDCYRLLHDFGLTGERFDAIKENARYKAVVEEFEKYAKTS
jgi:transcriptional regulator with XRE-family HTH domain